MLVLPRTFCSDLGQNARREKTVTKSIIICCDGTGDQFGPHNSNVVKMFELIAKTGQQVAYYNPGVGTMAAPSVVTRIGRRFNRLLGLGFGIGIMANVEDAHRFLMETFEPGDQIYIFGFSRGAYTARALAGLIKKCGILKHGQNNLLRYASRIYARESDIKVSNGFRRSFARKTDIAFLGLWDTVSSVGWIYNPVTLPFTANNPFVRTVRHAVSIDERRAFFRSNLWGRARDGQDIEQVWFPGVHSDVGGGYPNGETGPADIALDWMLRQVEGRLDIDPKARERLLYEGRVNIENPKIHMSLRGGWWLNEILPKPYYYQTPEKAWKKGYRINLGRRRKMPDGSAIHQSVLDRAAKQGYAPENLAKTYQVAPWDGTAPK